MAAVGDDNLFYNLGFDQDINGAIDSWNLTEGARLTTKADSQFGTTVRIDCKNQTTVTLDQDVMIMGDTNYGIRFRTRILQGIGSIKVRIANYPSAKSADVTKTDWTVVELYGKTKPDTQSIPVSFVVESSSTGCVVEIAQMEFVQTDTIPNGASYVWFYDRSAWEAQNTAEQQAQSIQGFPVLLMIAALYALVVFIVSRIAKKQDGEGRHTVYIVPWCLFLRYPSYFRLPSTAIRQTSTIFRHGHSSSPM